MLISVLKLFRMRLRQGGKKRDFKSAYFTRTSRVLHRTSPYFTSTSRYFIRTSLVLHRTPLILHGTSFVLQSTSEVDEVSLFPLLDVAQTKCIRNNKDMTGKKHKIENHVIK
jgi:hypothetical protein